MMKRMKFSSFYCSMLFLFLTACNSTKEPLISANANLLLEHSWKLIEIADLNGQTVFTPDTAWTYSVRFLSNGNITAQDACNACTGTYQIEPYNILSITLSCTEMVCAPPPSYSGYKDALGFAVEFKIVKDQLWIKYEDSTGAIFYLIHGSI